MLTRQASCAVIHYREQKEGERVAGGAGQRKEEQMRCGGRGGGPKAIVHVLRTKGSSGSVCKPTAGFSSLTRPHAGHNITDPLQQSRPDLLPVLRFEIFPAPL